MIDCFTDWFNGLSLVQVILGYFLIVYSWNFLKSFLFVITSRNSSEDYLSEEDAYD